MKKVFAGILILLTLLSFGTIGCAKQQGPANAQNAIPLKIGFAYGLSGPYSYWGLTHQRTFTVATDMINEKGGFVAGGKRYYWVPVFRDSKADPATTVSVVQTLINEDKCQFISTHGTAASLATVSTYKSAGVLNIVMGLPRPQTNGLDGGYGFAYCMDTYVDDYALYPWFKDELKVKTVALIVPNTESAPIAETDANFSANRTGIKIIGTERIVPGTKDFYPVITRVLKLNPDLIHLSATTPADNTLFVKQARELGFKGPMVLWSTDPKVLVDAVPAAALSGVYTDTNIIEAKTPEMKALYDRHVAKYGADKWDPITWLYHDYFTLLTKAIEKADSVEPAKVAAALEGMKFDTVMGPSFVGGKDRFGRDSVVYVPVGVVGFKDGKPYQALIATPKP